MASAFRKRLSRTAWDLRRFGLSPHGIRLRLRPPDAPSVIAISIPKAGTHLVERILCLHPLYHRRLTRKIMPADSARLAHHARRLGAGQVLSGHPVHSPRNLAAIESSGAKSVMIVRDPRDVVVSSAHYAYSLRQHAWYPRVSQVAALSDRLKLMIDGDETAGIPSIRQRLEQYAGWLSSGAHLVRYEELVSLEDRRETISELFAFLQTPVADGALDLICDNTVSSVSRTFRRGTSGEWSTAFDERLNARFNEAVGDLMPSYGYSVVEHLDASPAVDPRPPSASTES